MDVGVLAHIHDREMKAEGADRLAQIEQPSVRQIAVAVLAQGIDDHGQIGGEIFRRGVGLRPPSAAAASGARPSSALRVAASRE